MMDNNMKLLISGLRLLNPGNAQRDPRIEQIPGLLVLNPRIVCAILGSSAKPGILGMRSAILGLSKFQVCA